MPDTDHPPPPLPAITAAFDLIENLVDTYLELAAAGEPAGEPTRTKAVEAVLTETPALAALAEAVDLIESLTDPEPCQFDHNHSCQAHDYFYLDNDQPCPVQHAKDFVATYKPGEVPS